MAKVMYRRRTSLPTPPGGGGGAATLWSRFSYVGSVALPNFTSGTHKFSFIKGSPFAYDAVHDNYTMGCFAQHNGLEVIRVSLPAPVPHAQDGTVTGLPEATVLMPNWVDIADGQETVHLDLSLGLLCGGIVFDGTDVWWWQEPRYNGAASDHPVVGRSDNTSDLTNLNGDPPSDADLHWHNLCRCPTLVRQAWADANVGGKRFIVGVGTGIAQFQNSGPCVIAMDKPTTPSQVLTTQKLVYYPNETPYIWPSTGDPWHGSFQQMSQQWIVDGANDWLIQTGAVTLGQYSYKGSSPCNATEGGFWGYPWLPYAMVWHADDFLDAKQPHERNPREIIHLSQYFIRSDTCTWRDSHGTAWDQSRNRLWVMEPRGNDQPFDDVPVLHAFDLAA